MVSILQHPQHVKKKKTTKFDTITLTDDTQATTTESQSIDNRLGDWFTMRCDICLNDTPFSSFQHAKQHYKKVHNVTGYLVCCNKKFVKAKTVDNHLQWHINPEQNKYVTKCTKAKQ